VCQPSNSLSRSWTVGKGGLLRVVANCTPTVAAGLGESCESWIDDTPTKSGVPRYPRRNRNGVR
jgi:hypothetical protein